MKPKKIVICGGNQEADYIISIFAKTSKEQSKIQQ